MRADGKPIWIKDGEANSLKRIRLGGGEGNRSERWLQELIHRHPNCIPMDQIEPGLSRLVPVCMELGLSAGYVDNLFITPEGDIVIVETKLWRNPEARREVVAQALDYASTLFKMDYDSLEKAVLKAEFDGKEKPNRLYDIFEDSDTLEEPAFVDAINSNLRNGRIVVLIVGDGIRTEVETLTSGLQSHAGFHFTFALVELAVFEVSGDNELIVVPRTLAKTYMIERGIVRIDDQRSDVIAAPEKKGAAGRAPRQSITSEQFYEAMKEISPELPGKLQDFMEKLSDLGVYPDFKRSLNLKWDPPTGKTINLGYIMRNGELWTEVTGWFVPDPELAKVYNEDLASILGGVVDFSGANKHPKVLVNSHAPRVESLMEKFDDWHAAIERHLVRVRDYIENNLEDS